MAKNITLRMDENVLKQAKRAALEQDQSVSQWVSGLIAQAVARDSTYAAARRRALRILDTGVHLGGKPLTREQAHAR